MVNTTTKKHHSVKKWTIILLLCLLPTASIKAREQKVRDIDIKLTILNRGAVSVRESWDIDTGDRITEWYLVRKNLGDIEIRAFSVLDEKGNKLMDDGEWDVNRTLEQKAGKYGIVHKSDGVELCWGVGSHGDHKFHALYGMLNAVKSLNDYDMLHLQVVSPGLAAAPEHVKVTVEGKGVQLDTTNTRAWGFGFDGTTTFTDSCVVYESAKPFRTNNSVIVLLRFDKGLFQPTSVQERDFQDVLDVALKGASFADDPEEDDPFTGFLAFLATCAFIYFLFIRPIRRIFRKATGRTSRREKKKILGVKPKAVEWYREIPMDGNLAAGDYILKKLENDRKGNQLALAVILRLVHEGYLEPTRDLEGKVELMFTGKDTTGLPSYIKKFSDMLKESSGEDKILQDKEFSKWAKAHASMVYQWTNDASSSGYSYLKEKGCYNRNYKITKDGQANARKLCGLKKFLEDFTLVAQRETIEAKLWKEYLVYAALFGIADKVAKQLKDIDPKLFQETFNYNYNTFSTIMSTSRSISDFVNTASALGRPRPTYYRSGGSSYSGSSHSSRGGYGGYTSSRGGGGFSGGGRGGGGR